MSIKKLTVAAAIAVGIATCSLTSAMAACPCNTKAPEEALPVVTGPACPVKNQQATCPKCKKAIPDCGCKKKEPCPIKKQEPCPEKKKPDRKSVGRERVC